MNLLRTGMLLAGLTGLFLAIGYALGGEGGVLIALFAAAGMNFFSYWNSGSMMLRMHNARELTPQSSPELYRMTEGLARRAELPMPKLYFIETDQPNAFATGRNPEHGAVAVTRGIVNALSREELAGVIAHELAHIKNRDTLTMTVAASIAGAIGFLANFAFFFGGSEDRPNPIALIAIMLLSPIAAMLIQMGISRTREFSADELGARICGEPSWLASALRKIEAAARGRVLPTAERNPSSAPLFIVNPLSGRGATSLFRTHPPTEDRVRALMALDLGDEREAPSPAAPSPGHDHGQGMRPRKGPARRGSVPNAGGPGRSQGPWG